MKNLTQKSLVCFDVLIEISSGSSVKYEIDKTTGRLRVDRFLSTPMHYPMDYGYIPNTLAEDGDPLDVLVYAPGVTLMPGSLIACRSIGVLGMTDEAGQDDKILAVPMGKISKNFDLINNYRDIPSSVLQQVVHFFEHYKDLEEGKWVKLRDWMDADQAQRMVDASIIKGEDI